MGREWTSVVCTDYRNSGGTWGEEGQSPLTTRLKPQTVRVRKEMLE